MLQLDLTIHHERSFFFRPRRVEVNGSFSAPCGSIPVASFSELLLGELGEISQEFRKVVYFTPEFSEVEDLRGKAPEYLSDDAVEVNSDASVAPRAEELFFVEGLFVEEAENSEGRTEDRSGEPFVYRLSTRFLRFNTTHHIVHRLFREISPEHEPSLGAFTPLELLREVRCRIQVVRLGLDLFQRKQIFGVDVMPCMTFTLFLEVRDSSITLQLAREGASFTSYEHHGILRSIDRTLERLSLYNGFLARLRAEHVLEE